MNSLDSWQSRLPGAFTGETAPFGVHPTDHEMAEQMFHLALRQGATLADVVAEAKRYLVKQRCSKDFVEEQVERIEDFHSRSFSNLRSTRAWLVTLESQDQNSEVVSVIKAQRSAEFVREYMEQHYIDRFYSVREKLLYAASRKHNPSPARFEQVNGQSWQGRIHCGVQPRLYARLVKNLRLCSASGAEHLVWDEQEISLKVIAATLSLK